MRGVVVNDEGVKFQTDLPVPEPEGDEVRVRVLKAGICETDLQIIAGYMEFQGILGHEFVGIAQSGKFAGQRVVGEINCSCGDCEYCRADLGTHCPARTVLGIHKRDGAFADFLILPERNLHRVPDEVPTELAVFTEPLAAAFQIPAQLPLGSFPQVLVLGDGRLANLCAQVARLSGSRVIIAGKHSEKWAPLKNLGFEVLDVTQRPAGPFADLIIDCTGSASGLPAALSFVKPRGTIVMKTTIAEEHTLNLAPLVIHEITLVGSRCGPFDRALEALKKSEIDVSGLISETYSLNDVSTALERAQDRDVLKVLLDVNNKP